MTVILSEGDMAPDFNLTTDKFDEFRLSDYRDKKKVVLYFYPKDNTPGCSQQAEEFSGKIDEFRELNTMIVGMSKDDPETHEHFKALKKIKFTLVSDEEAAAMPDYNVWVKKNMYGKEYMGIERSTFLISEDGKIHKVWRKVKVKGHVDEVLEEVKKMT